MCIRDRRATIQPQSELKALRDQSAKDGLKTLRYSGAKQVAMGLTTIEEVVRVTPSEQ